MEYEDESGGSSEIDLNEYGFDPNKQMIKGGAMKSAVRFADADGDQLEEIEPSKLLRTMRKDTAFTEKFQKTIRVESNLVMDTKQSTEENLSREADEVFLSRKFRHQLLEQYMKKTRWRFDNRNQMESNARLVEWEDGSVTLFVGDDHYDIVGESTPNECYYTVHDDVMVQ